MQGKTRQVGEKTRQRTRHSAITINNKDPEYDYSWRNKKAIEDGGGQDIYGFEPIGAGNTNGETLGPTPFKQRTAGKGQLVYLDTIACKRKKEIAEYFKEEEDERYNAQVRHVQNASKRTRAALRQLDPNAAVIDKSNYSGPGMTQRPGPTEEE
jgi:hypothetical protein